MALFFHSSASLVMAKCVCTSVIFTYFTDVPSLVCMKPKYLKLKWSTTSSVCPFTIHNQFLDISLWSSFLLPISFFFWLLDWLDCSSFTTVWSSYNGPRQLNFCLNVLHKQEAHPATGGRQVIPAWRVMPVPVLNASNRGQVIRLYLLKSRAVNEKNTDNTRFLGWVAALFSA